VPEVVDAWRTDLKTKGRPKIAAAIASPVDHADLFEEDWENALSRERGSGAPAVNGDGAS